MSKLTVNLRYQQLRIICLPFLNNSPSNPNTIYSIVRYSIEFAKSIELSFIFITFDQPLYQKAIEITESSSFENSPEIHIRLGGFHLLMSYLGSNGYIMAGSGLKDVSGVLLCSIIG